MMNDSVSVTCRQKKILAVLSRDNAIDGIGSLLTAYVRNDRDIGLSNSAIILDASAFLRLGTKVDVVDYLSTRHAAPIILPGQSVQEFWNNALNVADTVATAISKKFDALKLEVEKLDDGFSDYSNRFNEVLEQFRIEFGYTHDPTTRRQTIRFLELLKEKAVTAYASRMVFSELAICRKKTKTPPGFKDDGDGDFFVWVDSLESLLIAKESGYSFTGVILVTNDKKQDWGRDGIPHPVLSAELRALLGMNLELWDVNKLVDKVGELSGLDD